MSIEHMNQDEILTLYLAATNQFMKLWQANESPEVLRIINDLLKNKKCQVVVKVHTRGPFGLQLQLVGGDEDLTLLTLCETEATVNCTVHIPST